MPHILIKQKVPGLLVEETGRKPNNKHQQQRTPRGKAHTTPTPRPTSQQSTLAGEKNPQLVWEEQVRDTPS